MYCTTAAARLSGAVERRCAGTDSLSTASEMLSKMKDVYKNSVMFCTIRAVYNWYFHLDWW